MMLSPEQQRVVEDNLALVRKVISDRVYGIRNIGIFAYDDLFQIGCIGLCKAAYTDKYQKNSSPGENTHFSTYAYRLILNEILSQLEYATIRRAEQTVDPHDWQIAEHTEPVRLDEDVLNREFAETLHAALQDAAALASGVTAKGIKALVYSAQGYSSTEIAVMLGAKSCHNVTAWISKARKYLKKDPSFTGLFDPS